MYLNHGVEHILNMLQFRPRCETDTEISTGVTGQHHSRTGRIDFVARVTDLSDPRNIGGCGTATIDGLGVVLPKTG